MVIHAVARKVRFRLESRTMERFWPKLRALSLLAAGSIMVHELRYVAAYGSNAGEALSEQGHSYAPTIEALAALLVLVAFGRFTFSLLRARCGIVADPKPATFRRLWLGASVALAALYTFQEGFEGAFAPGHPSGLIGVYGHGGWSALIFALAIGAVIAALTRLAHGAIELVAARAAASRHRRAPARLSWAVLPTPPGRRFDVLAWNLAGRAPPPA
jgi:hypothetical protein